MSEEEKKAIERIEDVFYQDLGKGINKFQKITLYEDSITNIRTILNLIKKQQKEIEELKSQLGFIGEQNNYISRLEKEIKLMKSININDNYISKEEIRKHLKKFEEIEKEFIFIDNKSTAREINKALIEFSKRLLEE